MYLIDSLEPTEPDADDLAANIFADEDEPTEEEDIIQADIEAQQEQAS